MVFGDDRYIVGREFGSGTTGASDILVDNRGGRWRIIERGEAELARQTTAEIVATIDCYGRIR